MNKISRKNSHGRIEIAEGIDVTEILGRMLVGLLKAAVVIVDDGIENLGEDGVRLGIGRVDTNPGIMVLQTGLNDVQESGAERGLSSLKLIEDLLGQMFLQQRFTVGFSQLRKAGFQLVQNRCVHHVVTLFTATNC